MVQALAKTKWVDICAIADIAPNTGVCALVSGEQVAIFRVGDTNNVYAKATTIHLAKPLYCLEEL